MKKREIKIATDFITAVWEGKIDIGKDFIHGDVGIKYYTIKDSAGKTILHYAAATVRAEIILLLLEQLKASNKEQSEIANFVNIQDKEGYTALNYLFSKLLSEQEKGFTYKEELVYKTVNILIENGADLNIGNNSKRLPLHLASKIPSLEERIFMILLEKTNDNVLHGRYKDIKENPINNALLCNNCNLLKAYNSHCKTKE